MIDELRSIQHQFGYLPADRLQELAAKIQVPLSQIHAVASFYPHFHLTPPVQAEVRVCADMACHLRGGPDLKRGLEQAFRGGGPETVAVRNVSCLGRCDHAPALSINDQIYSNLDEHRAGALVRDVLSGRELPAEARDHHHRAQVASDPYNGAPKYSLVRQFVETPDWNGVIATLKASGLRGMGGAGFPTGSKWEIVRNAPGKEKYIVCNADESEPGTIKDRFILGHLTHLVIEGMILAGLVTGARKGILYIRHEYEPQEHLIAEEIRDCYERGLLGPRVCGTDLQFDLELFVSPGGYICGEETALMEAIEGKRAEPRNKPPFPVYEGLWGKPTALNNVETFANVPQILVNGVDWYKSQGANGCAGLKFVGVSGDVRNPGIYLIPMGTPMEEVIFQHGGGMEGDKRLKAFAPSGPSSGYLPASMVDVHIDFKSLAAAGSMMGSAAIVVCAEGRCMLDMALNAVRFFRNESCGKCVPCRNGSQKMTDILTGWTQGKGTAADLGLLDELTEAMKLASICGLGQFAHSPISSVIKHFRPEIEAHILEHRCPEGVCPMRDIT